MLFPLHPFSIQQLVISNCNSSLRLLSSDIGESIVVFCYTFHCVYRMWPLLTALASLTRTVLMGFYIIYPSWLLSHDTQFTSWQPDWLWENLHQVISLLSVKPSNHPRPIKSIKSDPIASLAPYMIPVSPKPWLDSGHASLLFVSSARPGIVLVALTMARCFPGLPASHSSTACKSCQVCSPQSRATVLHTFKCQQHHLWDTMCVPIPLSYNFRDGQPICRQECAASWHSTRRAILQRLQIWNSAIHISGNNWHSAN